MHFTSDCVKGDDVPMELRSMTHWRSVSMYFSVIVCVCVCVCVRVSVWKCECAHLYRKTFAFTGEFQDTYIINVFVFMCSCVN